MPRSLFAELKRRNVWRAAALYAAAAWLLVQIATQVFPLFHVPEGVLRGIVVAVVLGFPFWIAFAWLYEMTPDGLKRESEVDRSSSVAHHTGKKLDRWIIGTLALAVVLLLANTFVWHKGVGLGGPGEAEAAEARSIAVLPFENLSSDKEQEYFADGISEDLLNLLAEVPALRVAARTSSFSFKGKELKVEQIADQLHVAHVLEGSVRRAGNEVRVTARLVHAADGYEVWSQSWDRKLDDVFAVQDEIAADVVKQLRVKLLGAAPQTHKTDPRAYALYLQARELGRQRSGEAFLRSDSLYRQVLAIDPRYAPAWMELARNFVGGTSIGMISNQEGFRRAREGAEKALAIDPNYALPYTILARTAGAQGDLAGAARQYERALALDPTNVEILGSTGGLLWSLGRAKEAIAVWEFVVSRDPVNASSLFNLGLAYRSTGRYDDAVTRLRTVLNLSPGRGGAHFQLGLAFLLKGDATGALAEMGQEPSEMLRLVGFPIVFHALGRKADADAALAELVRKYPKDAPYNIAYVYAYRGEADRAFEWLDKAVQYGDPGLAEIPPENLFDNIRSDPRWLPFLRKIGKAPEQLEKIQFRVRLPEGAARAGSSAGVGE